MGQSKPELQKLGGQQLPPQKRRPPAPGQARQRRLAPGQAFPSRYEIKTSFSLQGFCGSSRAKLRALERARAGSRAGPFRFRLSCHAAGLGQASPPRPTEQEAPRLSAPPTHTHRRWRPERTSGSTESRSPKELVWPRLLPNSGILRGVPDRRSSSLARRRRPRGAQRRLVLLDGSDLLPRVRAETRPALVPGRPGRPGRFPSHGRPCGSSRVTMICVPFVGPSPGRHSAAALRVSKPSPCSPPELSLWLPPPSCAVRGRGPIRSLARLEHNGLPQSGCYTPLNAAYARGSFLAGVSHGWLTLSLCSAKPPRSFSHQRFSFGK